MAKIADVFSLIRNGANIKQGLDDSGYPITRIETISNRTVDRSKMGYAGVTDISKYSDYVLQDGDILMSHINSETHLGKVALYEKQEEEKVIHGMNLLCLRPQKELIDSRFAFYYLSSGAFLRQIPRITKKSVNQASFNVAALKELTIPIPVMEKQQAVINSLDKVSELIALRKEQLAKLDQLVKSRFIELFGTVKNNHQGYPVIKISGCAKLQGGFAFKSSDYLANGIRLVQISNVNKDTLDWDSINCVPQAFLQKYKDFELHVGDLVLAMTRPVIKSLDAVKIATVSEADVPSLLNQRVGRFVIDKTILNPVYLMLCCQMAEFREYVEAMSGNSLQPNISSKQVEDYSIVLPPLELQEQFAVFVEQTDKSKLAIQQSLDKLELLKKSLMQEYFG